MRFMIALLVVAAAVVASADNVPFNICGSSPQHVTVKSISVNPNPPVPGRSVTVNVVGSSDETVTAGSYSINVAYLGITILTQNGDLCTLDPAFPCPIAAGPISLSETLDVPSIAPQGAYTIQVSAVDQNRQTLFCVAVNINIGASAEPVQIDTGANTVEEIPEVEIPEAEIPEPQIPEAEIEIPEADIPEADIPQADASEEEQDFDLPDNTAEPIEDVEIEFIEDNQEEITEDSQEQDAEGDSEEEDIDEDAEYDDDLDLVNTLFAPFNKWSSCSDAQHSFQITSITTPDGAPVRGKQFTILVEGNLNKRLTSGTVTLKTSYEGIPVSTLTGDFCEAVANTTACPWEVGPQVLKYVSIMPADIPSGNFIEKLTSVDQNNAPVMCVSGSFAL